MRFVTVPSGHGVAGQREDPSGGETCTTTTSARGPGSTSRDGSCDSRCPEFDGMKGRLCGLLPRTMASSGLRRNRGVPAASLWQSTEPQRAEVSDKENLSHTEPRCRKENLRKTRPRAQERDGWAGRVSRHPGRKVLPIKTGERRTAVFTEHRGRDAWQVPVPEVKEVTFQRPGSRRQKHRPRLLFLAEGRASRQMSEAPSLRSREPGRGTCAFSSVLAVHGDTSRDFTATARRRLVPGGNQGLPRPLCPVPPAEEATGVRTLQAVMDILAADMPSGARGLAGQRLAHGLLPRTHRERAAKEACGHVGRMGKGVPGGHEGEARGGQEERM